MYISIQIEKFSVPTIWFGKYEIHFPLIIHGYGYGWSPQSPQPVSSHQPHRCRRSVHIAQFEIERG